MLRSNVVNTYPSNGGYQHYPQQTQQPQLQHDVERGRFDLGGGHHLQVKVDGKTPEQYLKDRASSMIWGWIIGAAIIGIAVISLVGVGIYVYVVAKDDSSPVDGKAAATAAAWDGKSTLQCSGNDVMTVKGVSASVSDTAIRATGNCQLTLVNVNLTAPVAIEAGANAKVTMKGGSITATSNSVVASASSKVMLDGTKVTGKSKKSGGAKIDGAP